MRKKKATTLPQTPCLNLVKLFSPRQEEWQRDRRRRRRREKEEAKNGREKKVYAPLPLLDVFLFRFLSQRS
jgi:hypothetical protein